MKWILFTSTAEVQFEGWSKVDKIFSIKLLDFIEAIENKLFEGIGKSEA